ncbi:unnamed protein product [Rotaria socialis]|uniref:Uncharacterized protein n=2 Tax=Rotaria socialis TaxID=392032 RepID=A0A821DXG1_9BILA|nr:unnamed protein product [Rotaria socialis]CAF4628129.1 unnamed protein product [Rotaria socialis]
MELTNDKDILYLLYKLKNSVKIIQPVTYVMSDEDDEKGKPLNDYFKTFFFEYLIISYIIVIGERGETVYEAPGGNHLLNTYCHDFIADAEKGKFGYIIGLNQIISECINILLRQTKNSVLLIGAPGVGKKAIVKSLAHRIVHQNVHHDVSKHLFALNMEALTGKA